MLVTVNNSSTCIVLCTSRESYCRCIARHCTHFQLKNKIDWRNTGESSNRGSWNQRSGAPRHFYVQIFAAAVCPPNFNICALSVYVCSMGLMTNYSLLLFSVFRHLKTQIEMNNLVSGNEFA